MIRYDLIELCTAAGAIAPLLESKDAGAKALGDDLTDILILAVTEFVRNETLADRLAEVRKKRAEMNAMRRGQAQAASYSVMERIGPALWNQIHKRAAGFDGVDASREIDYIVNKVSTSIPCPVCKRHYTEYLATHPIAAPLTREDYFKWTVDLHNYVNKVKDKPTPEISLEEAKKIWGY